MPGNASLFILTLAALLPLACSNGAIGDGAAVGGGSSSASGAGGAASGGAAAGGFAPGGHDGGTGGSGGAPGGAAPGGGAGGGAGGDGGSGGGAPPHPCPPVGAQDCSPGPGTGEADQCTDAPSCFLSAVQGAVNGTIAAQPSWFAWDDAHSCWGILELDLFLDAVVSSLESGGLCAIRDPNAPGEEVTVKHDNAYAENFDIVASFGCARSGAGIYTGYCAPAWW